METMRTARLLSAVAMGLILAPAGVFAEECFDHSTDDHLFGDDDSDETRAEQSEAMGKYQLGLSAGGGLSDFANVNVRDITDVGGAWSARLIVGTRRPVAFEAGYIGTANKIATLGLDAATLVAHGIEGALRLQLVNVPLNRAESILLAPYLVAGFAWKHYVLSGAAFNTSNVRTSDNVFEVPLGVGLNWSFGRVFADQRFDYRPAVSEDLVGTLGPGNNPTDNGLQTWTLSVRVGVEL